MRMIIKIKKNIYHNFFKALCSEISVNYIRSPSFKTHLEGRVHICAKNVSPSLASAKECVRAAASLFRPKKEEIADSIGSSKRARF